MPSQWRVCQAWAAPPTGWLAILRSGAEDSRGCRLWQNATWALGGLMAAKNATAVRGRLEGECNSHQPGAHHTVLRPLLCSIWSCRLLPLDVLPLAASLNREKEGRGCDDKWRQRPAEKGWWQTRMFVQPRPAAVQATEGLAQPTGFPSGAVPRQQAHYTARALPEHLPAGAGLASVQVCRQGLAAGCACFLWQGQEAQRCRLAASD